MLALRIRFCHFSIYFVRWIFFSAFYYLICFLVFCLAFRLHRSFVNRYFAILIRFQFLVFPCFLSLYSWCRAASSERTIAIVVCMFCGPFVFAHGCYMKREFRREMFLESKVLLSSNISHTKLLNFPKIQTVVLTYSFIPGGSNMTILVFSMRSFHFWYSLSYSP